ncbi:DNA-binding transcriptional LysR family regulator [Shimia isoporae]|uniref:DNA-binding transcriptional LysR family regulator n=2 Tax=Shimia isoporae TaxID=647720 RepID=A0A4R1NNJ7_9RHOB|nr:DNA-binding transcriptional LysR family regulator [Shimia isoporae]
MDRMEKLNWDDLRVLSAVIEKQSLNGAAKRLQIDPATVSRRINRLSKSLGVSVYSKRADGWQPNPEIEKFLDLVNKFEHDLEVAITEMHSIQNALPQKIAVAAPAAVLTTVLLPNFEKLKERSPSIRLSLHRAAKLSHLGQNDLIVTALQPEQGRLMVQSIGKLTLEAFAPPDMKPENETQWIGGDGVEDPFCVENFGKEIFGTKPTHRVDTFADALQLMVLNGCPSILPRVVARKFKDDLVRLDSSRTKAVPLYLCYHESRRDDRSLRTVIDWIRETFVLEGALCKAKFPDPK